MVPDSTISRAPKPVSGWVATCAWTFWRTRTPTTPANTSGANNRFSNGYTWRSRESLDIDTRTGTEYGVVRTVFDATFSWTTDSYGATGGGATVYAPIGTAAATGNATGGSVAGR